MSDRESYAPGPAHGAEIRKDGEQWTLVLVRELRHSPQKVWGALTEPAQLREWAPFDADRDLSRPGSVTLTTVGAPAAQPSHDEVLRAEAPRVLEVRWGGQHLKWDLEPLPDGRTRLTLWHTIDRRFIAMGAAGWHVCLGVLDLLLAGRPIGRIVGKDALEFAGWQRLHAEYARQFGVEAPSWSSQSSNR
jgi:uncharacterized protein YndB with AHSA1/START domain